ncbi:MAG: hypothetical protein E4H01_03355 [Lysobacterales bacterium]|nr:MAG: hypothetical protein E4H01_03355 [Xanthomonadales bacterium]
MGVVLLVWVGFLFGQIRRGQSESGVLGNEFTKERGHFARGGVSARGHGRIDELFSPSASVGVLVFVLWIQPREDLTAAGIGKVNIREIPGRVAHTHLLDMPVSGRKLEAHAFDADRPVAPALRARTLHRESLTKDLEGRAGASHILGGHETPQGRIPGLGMHLAVVFHFDPGLRGLVKPRQRQLRAAVQHREQAAFNLAPEGFLLAVLIRAVGQGRLMHQAQPLKTLHGLAGLHGAAVVGHQRPRQSALEECCVLGTPCLTLRWNTERPVTLQEHGGASVLVGNNIDRIRAAYRDALTSKRNPQRPELWDGKTAPRIVEALAAYGS